ncbi:hypothetical protein IWQ56_006924, partial [Coemansia nantahalensis]
ERQLLAQPAAAQHQRQQAADAAVVAGQDPRADGARRGQQRAQVQHHQLAVRLELELEHGAQVPQLFVQRAVRDQGRASAHKGIPRPRKDHRVGARERAGPRPVQLHHQGAAKVGLRLGLLPAHGHAHPGPDAADDHGVASRRDAQPARAHNRRHQAGQVRHRRLAGQRGPRVGVGPGVVAVPDDRQGVPVWPVPRLRDGHVELGHQQVPERELSVRVPRRAGQDFGPGAGRRRGWGRRQPEAQPLSGRRAYPGRRGGGRQRGQRHRLPAQRQPAARRAAPHVPDPQQGSWHEQPAADGSRRSRRDVCRADGPAIGDVHDGQRRQPRPGGSDPQSGRPGAGRRNCRGGVHPGAHPARGQRGRRAGR